MELGLLKRLGRKDTLELLDGASCRGDGVLGQLDEIAVQRGPQLRLGCMLDREVAALGPTQVVREREHHVLGSPPQPPH